MSHESTGLLVPLSDPAAIADSVERLMDDPALARRLAARASQAAADRFSVERYSAELVGLLSEVSAPRPRPS